ncbi:MAG TPA: HAMP domain-containing histidine kinase [bacterium]|nr:HAMP domain-containing histidine kinase [bacterium]
MMRISNKIKMPKISAGTLKAFIFIFLIIVAIAFWLYTQLIIDHIREFQKSVVETQKDIHVNIIDPYYSDATAINSDLFQKGVIDLPFPIIFSDEHNNPIPGLWRNVGITADNTGEKSMRKLKKIIQKMDRINKPDSLFMPALKPRTDTLTVFEMPPSMGLPVAVTDQVGNLLYGRNIIDSPDDSLDIMSVISELDTLRSNFNKENEPPLVFYGINGHRRWPLIVTRKNGDPLYWQDVSVAASDTSSTGVIRLKSQMNLMRRRGIIYDVITHYISGYDTLLYHYGDPKFITWIVWLPVIEFLVILILISIGFIGFKNITNAEQSSIWVGMAKETAHQLGTPISSINGWLELLKTERDISHIDKAVNNMEYDLKRLTRVVSRFSNIGSKPVLQPINVSDVIEEVMEYFRARVPQMGRSVVLQSRYNNLKQIMGNHELLNWAVENLIKNALASIDNKDGRISVTGSMSKDFKYLIIDFEDNGKGIAFAEQKKIMKPGYTTKMRGWGLGLSLVKRIIEEYHGGKIILIESMPGVGSTFRVILPSVNVVEKS